MNEKIFICDYCCYSTKRKYDLKRHLIGVHKVIFNNENVNEKNNVVNQAHDDFNINQQDDGKKYECDKCNKQYRTSLYLLKHQETCKGIDILTCPKCMKTFSSRFSKSAHIKKNNCKARSIIHLDNEYIKKDGNFINNFDNERTDYITFDDMIRIFNSGNNIIPNYIEFKYFNKNFPENHNIKYKQNKGCLIKKNDGWTFININYLTNNLIENNSFKLQQYYNKHIKEIDDKIKNTDILNLINSKITYLNILTDKKLFTFIKQEVKNKIKSLSL
jgi:hypothetical protein